MACLGGSLLADMLATAATFACLFVLLFVIAAASLDVVGGLPYSPPPPSVLPACLPLNMAECQNFGKVFKLKFQLRK